MVRNTRHGEMIVSETENVRLPRFLPASVVFVAAAVFIAMWLSASLWFPFGWDQGMFAAIGDIIQRGGMPYRDGWDMKGPLAYYPYAWAQELFGRHMWSIRLFDLPLLIAAMAGLASIVGRLTTRLYGWWAAIVYALWIGSLTWFHAAQPDGWVAGFVILAAVPVVPRRPSTARLALSGLLIGLTGLIKPLYLAFLAVPLVHVAGRAEWKRGPKLVAAAALIGAALAPLLLAVAWFAYRGALRDLIEVHLLYTFAVYSGSAGARIRDMTAGMLKYFFTGTVVFALPVIAVGVRALWRSSRESAVSVITWALVAVGGAAAQDKFYKYHWIPLFPPLVILGVVGCHRLLQGKTAGWRKLAGAAALALAAFAVCEWAIAPASSVVQWLQLVTGRIGSDQYYTAHATGGFVAGDDMKTARYILVRTKPDEGITVWGNNALIEFLSGRPSPTRFIFALPLTEGGPSSPRDSYRREYINALKKNPPVYFVAGLPWGGLHKDQALNGFPELRAFLQERYYLETRIGGLDLYRLN
jgi:hypothetical protein